MMTPNEIKILNEKIFPEFMLDLDRANNILFRLVKTLNWLLQQKDLSIVDYNKILYRFGELTKANRAYFFKRVEKDGLIYYECENEWDKNECISLKQYFGNVIFYEDNVPYIFDNIENCKCINSSIKDLPEIDRKILSKMDTKSILILPLICPNSMLLGFVGFDNCDEEREWGNTELNALKAVSIIIGTIYMLNEAQNKEKEYISKAIIELKSTREKIEKTNNSIINRRFAYNEF